MKKILYMAVTTNGLIAKNDDSTDWISEKEWDSYSKIVRETGQMIIGHRTYNILTKQPEFSEFKDVKIVVVAHEDFPLLSGNHSIAHSPKEAIEYLESKESVVIAGGGILNSAFISQNLVDEIYLDIEPVVLGKGIKVFNDADFKKDLELLNINKISDNEIQVHYRVLK